MADTTSVVHAPPAWRFAGPDAARRPSLAEVHTSIPLPQGGIWLRRFLAFVGPGYMVAVGYMDPGNWATYIASGARFGYTLLSVILLSNLMAILLQALAARLGIVTGRDLAQACRDSYPRPVSFALWLACEGRDQRLRPGRSDRHRDRTAAAVRHTANCGGNGAREAAPSCGDCCRGNG